MHSLALSPDGDKVDHRRFVHHDERLRQPGLRSCGGRPGVGERRTANQSFPANLKVRNAGANSAITGLSSDADSLYVSGFVFGAGGNLEGIARINWSDLSVELDRGLPRRHLRQLPQG